MNIISENNTVQAITGQKKVIFNAGFEASFEYAEPNKNTSPNVHLLFSPFGLPFIPIDIIGTNINKIISNLLWTKDRNNPGGICQVTIVPDTKTIQNIVDILNKVSFNFYTTLWNELGVDLEDLFKPMSLCQMWINGYHVMTGTVRACSRSVKVSNTSKDVSYDITIDELGNIYNMSTTSLDLILKDAMQTNIMDSLSKSLGVTSDLKGTTIANGLYALLGAFWATTFTEGFKLSDGFPVGMRLLALANPMGAIALNSLASYMTADVSLFQLNSSNGSSQSMWSFMKSFIPTPWMEFFTESGGRTMVVDPLGAPSVLFPGLNYVVSRSVPYSNPLLGFVNPKFMPMNLLFDLTAIHLLIGGDFIIITDDIIIEKDIGVDCVNHATVFHTTYGSKSVMSSADTRDRPVKSIGPMNPFASGGIPTFGIREMTQSIDCTNLQGLGTTISAGERIARNILGITGPPAGTFEKNHFSNLLSTWFRNQARFREGTITTRGIPYARAGMYCLYLPSLSGKKADNVRDIGIYYIDSINHQYGMSNKEVAFTTTLNLVRGVPLPTSVAKTALLLFDYEVLPPDAGIADGVYTVMKNLRRALSPL